MDFDDKFLDIDFPSCREFTFGACARPQFAGERFTTFEDSVPLIPRSDWQRLSEEKESSGGGAEHFVTRIYDQGQEGSCVGNATAQSLEILQAKQFGKDRVIPLSAISCYKQIGRSPQSGATIDDAWDAVNGTGVIPLDTPENRTRFNGIVMPHRGFHTPYPNDWKETAKLFRGDEGQVIRSVDGLVTSLLLDDPVVVGRQGHSIVYLKVFFKNGRLFVLYVNSWWKWGQGAGDFDYGFGVDSESQIRMSADWAFSLRSIVVSPKVWTLAA